MGAPTPAVCTPPSTQPPDYSKTLNRGVPPVEGKTTPLFPKATVGPSDRTWYFPIDVGVSGFHATGVFLPDGFSYGDEVDVILFFHGNKQGDFKTINEYWNGKLHNIVLRDDLNTSGKNAILVAPTLGENPGHGMRGNADLGIFVNAGAGLTYLDEVMDWLGKYEPTYANKCVVPKVRKVILAGHSGGGNPIHLQMESMKIKLAEIWCFDVVYGNVADWIHIAHFNPTKRVTIYHAIQSLDSLKELVKLKDAKDKEAAAGKGRPLDNLEIIKGGNHHFPCLTDNFLPQAKRSNALGAR
jgi:hypothetical protein